jgi:hypothetical protein
MKCCQKKGETFNNVIETTDTRVEVFLLKFALSRHIHANVVNRQAVKHFNIN